MGDAIVAGFGFVAMAGLVLLGVGLLRHSRLPVLLGLGLLLALAGEWMLGLPGLAAGLVPLAFVHRTDRSGTN